MKVDIPQMDQRVKNYLRLGRFSLLVVKGSILCFVAMAAFLVYAIATGGNWVLGLILVGGSGAVYIVALFVNVVGLLLLKNHAATIANRGFTSKTVKPSVSPAVSLSGTGVARESKKRNVGSPFPTVTQNNAAYVHDEVIAMMGRRDVPEDGKKTLRMVKVLLNTGQMAKANSYWSRFLEEYDLEGQNDLSAEQEVERRLLIYHRQLCQLLVRDLEARACHLVTDINLDEDQVRWAKEACVYFGRSEERHRKGGRTPFGGEIIGRPGALDREMGLTNMILIERRQVEGEIEFERSLQRE